METLGKILVPIDVNTDCKEQISSAIKIAKAYKSGVILMYVISDQQLKEDIKLIIEKSASELLNKAKDSFEAEGIEVAEAIIKCGNIVEIIAQKANANEVNLIVIGENEAHKRAKYRLSAKSEQIIRASEVPVYLTGQKSKTTMTNILCPVDFSEPSKRALSSAILLAKKFNANLTILNIFESIEYISYRINIDIEAENNIRLERAQKEMEAFMKEFDLEGVNHTIQIESGEANEKILKMIEDQNIDLLLMGTNGRTGLSGLIMGSVTQKVIREIPCSFITVKKIKVIGVSKVSYV
jgi:nucleotide-binding universal stress UspA family protein